MVNRGRRRSRLGSDEMRSGGCGLSCRFAGLVWGARVLCCLSACMLLVLRERMSNKEWALACRSTMARRKRTERLGCLGSSHPARNETDETRVKICDAAIIVAHHKYSYSLGRAGSRWLVATARWQAVVHQGFGHIIQCRPPPLTRTAPPYSPRAQSRSIASTHDQEMDFAMT